MKYRNVVTGIEFETKDLITGANIVPVEEVTPKEPEEPKAKVAKPAKKKGAKK